jgi:hypothetical protein
MKANESTDGAPLNGVTVKVTNNFFLFSLSSAGADRQRNIQLIKQRSWIDVPIVYDDGSRATLVIERDALGERALAVLDPPGRPASLPSSPLERYAALPPSTQPGDPARPKPGPAIVIAGDRGGVMRDYYERYRAQVAVGSLFRIDGRCASACTLVLVWPDRVCITGRAELGFHQIRDEKTGRVTPETRQTTERLLASYPAPVRDYIAAHGGLPDPAGMLWVRGAALHGMVKSCEPLKSEPATREKPQAVFR